MLRIRKVHRRSRLWKPMMASRRIIQCNLNRCWGAHHAAEMGIALCTVSEPARVPDRWFASRNGLVAIWWFSENEFRVCSLVERGEWAVAVRCDEFKVVSCYVSPNCSYEEFLEFLDELEGMCGRCGEKIMVCGDFNSRSLTWGSSSTDLGGERVEE